MRERVARALSVPQHHTSWPLLTFAEKDLFYRQADAAIAVVIEECADVADNWGVGHPHIAKAIRALKDNEHDK